MAITHYVSPFARWLLLVPLGIVAVFAVVPAFFTFPDEPQGHALSHGLPAIVFAIAAAGIARTHAAHSRGERLALGALAMMAIAQLLESISAFTEYPNAGVLHDTTSIVSMLSLGAVLVGVLWAIADAVRGNRFPAWAALLVLGGLGALVLRMLIGF